MSATYSKDEKALAYVIRELLWLAGQDGGPDGIPDDVRRLCLSIVRNAEMIMGVRGSDSFTEVERALNAMTPEQVERAIGPSRHSNR